MFYNIRPGGDVNKPLRALLFDSWYDTYVGVVCLMAVVDGKLQKGEKTKRRLISEGSVKKTRVSVVRILIGRLLFLS